MAKAKEEKKVQSRRTTADVVTIKIPVSKNEIIEEKGAKYVALELIYKRMSDYPWDVKNRFRTYIFKGKYNTSTKCGVRVVSYADPVLDDNTTVLLEFSS